jgi:hypothetical protein
MYFTLFRQKKFVDVTNFIIGYKQQCQTENCMNVVQGRL